MPWPRWNKTDNTEGILGTKLKNGGIIPPFDADLKNPRSNPLFKSPALALHDTYFDIMDINARAVIVDNQDSAYDDRFDGTSTNRRPYWGDNYRWTNDRNDWAKFTPNLTAGKYTVWAYWPCENSADEKAEIELDINGTPYTELRSQRADSDSTVKAGYCGEWIPLFNKQLYTLPAGNNTSLTITRTRRSTGDYTYADAVAFLPEGESEVAKTIHVKNAHYYMVHDKNGDGKLQNDDGTVQRDDEVYLVNFVWTDSDNDNKVEEGEVLRHYYLVSYDNDADNHEDVTGLQEVAYNPADPASDDVPDVLQPKTYDEDGNPDGYVSDLDDLQNFANWFSFYRRRELTAKAAVSRTIVDLDNVYVGFNTM